MRGLAPTLVLLASVAIARVDVAAAGPMRGLRLAPVDELHLAFLDADEHASLHQGTSGDATIDVGRMSAKNCMARGCMRTVVQRRFRIRVEGSALRTRFVRVQAFVQDDMSQQRLRIDGRPLGSAPTLIDAAIPVGVPVAHTLEIEVPVSAPEGLVAQTIVWQVESIQ